ncbi:MAG: hypothetical protein L0J12_06055 [Enterobacterales bacterium]|nr:hypothetical protein [Enterobacterales bacterium]
MIPTGVDQVAINFGTPNQRWLNELDLEQAEQLIAQGQFGAGSMQPKVEAITQFIRQSAVRGKTARGLITRPESIKLALQHQTGTWITR